MSPQEGKSERVSRRFVLWMLKRNPDLRIAVISYAQKLAERWGRRVREDIEHNPRLGLRLAKGSAAVAEWQLDGHDGGVVCVGIGAGLTGRPVDVMIIDDPYSGREEADSEAYRERALEWWQEVGSTRLAPGAIVVCIMCMTGDTPVLRPDGTETPLRDIRPGDEIATSEGGRWTL